MVGFTAQTIAASDMQDTSRHLYDRVMEEFKHGDYEAALAGFKFFIELHRKSVLVGNAQYWIGECQYRLGRYKDALNSFSNVGSYDPTSQKLAASAFKIGFSALSLRTDHLPKKNFSSLSFTARKCWTRL